MVARLREHNESTIIKAAADGATIAEICDLLGVSPYMLWKYEEEHPEFTRLLERASVRGGRQRLAKLVAEIDADLRNERIGERGAKARIDVLRFYLEKQFPAVFSPKQQLEVTHTIDLRGVIEAAKSRKQIIDITPSAVTLAAPVPPDTETVYAPAVIENATPGDTGCGG